MEMNDKLQKVLHAGLGLALVAKEHAEQVFDELAEKGKTYKDQFEMDDDCDFDQTDAENSVDEDFDEHTEEDTSSKFFDMDQLEKKAKQVLDAALTRLQLAKSEVEESMESRIENLEEKLNALVDAALETMDLERKSSSDDIVSDSDEDTTVETEEASFEAGASAEDTTSGAEVEDTTEEAK